MTERERCSRCGARQPQIRPNEDVLDLVADVLEAPTRLAAHDVLVKLDRLTAARVGVVLAVLVRRDRMGLRHLVRRIREKAATDRTVSAEVAQFDEQWRLLAESGEGCDDA